MKLNEVLEQQAEVKNYKNDRPCDFRKLLKRADSGYVLPRLRMQGKQRHGVPSLKHSV